MSANEMQDVVLEESTPAGGGKKNKKKRGKAANVDNKADDKDPEKMAEQFNAEIQKEIDQMKTDFEKEKAELLA